MKFGVLRFPGSCDEVDALLACRRYGDAELLWHHDRDLHGADVVVVPGGFSNGDYLRAGAIARFSPVMEAVAEHAAAGGLVFGICNGFQVLCEAHLLPGALIRNAERRFVCRDQRLRITNAGTPWTADYEDGQELVIPIKNIDGGFVAAERVLDELEGEGRVVARYLGPNPNGSYRDIAGICNPAGNVVGLMPHPEHAIDPLTGPSADGLGFFTSVLSKLVSA